MIRTNVHHLLREQAEARPEAPALTYRGETRTYAETWTAVGEAVAQLRSLNVQRGDRVAIYMEKRFELVTTIFASSVVGALFVPVNHVLKAHQVGHILADCGSTVLVTSSDRLAQLGPVLAGSSVTDVIVIGDTVPEGSADHAVHAWGEVTVRIDGGDSGAIDVDPAAILYTSGSTGKPKGVVLSHRNLIVGAESVSTYLRNTSDDVILSALPLSFDAGLSQVTTAFAVGAHCVLMNYLLPRDVPKICAVHGVTGITAVPPLWIQLADLEWPNEVASRIRYWANTGGRMPGTTLERLRAVFTNADPFLMYGLTEAFRSTYLDPAEVERRPGSIGKAIPNAEILVLRPDGSRCEPGEPGELVHRGALVALGYWNDEVRSEERFRPVHHPGGHWSSPELAVWSGDTVVADDEGFLSFVGRADDMIKTSGYRVSPTEVEEAAYGTGLVRDVVAIGVDDPALGQRIVLVATASAGELIENDVKTALRPLLPAYMLPARVLVWPDLPRSPNGKFDRPLITARCIRETA